VKTHTQVLEWSKDDLIARAITAIPIDAPKRSGVYFLISQDKVVYVGQSTNVFQRIATHAYTSDKEFEAFAFVNVPQDELLHVERHYIRSFKPALNDERMTRVSIPHPNHVEPTGPLAMNPMEGKLLVSEQEAADALGMTPRTMQEWRRRGGGPPFVRISSRCVRYRPDDLREWAGARIRTSTSDVREDGA
jgi:predicted GIY-YIG superfamily endonuclease